MESNENNRMNNIEKDIFSDVLKDRQIWWVNQGITFDAERDSGSIWAPIKTKSGKELWHWKTLADMKAGDIVLHYAKGHVRCVSRVISPAKIKNNKPKYVPGGEGWGVGGRQVMLEYHDLNPTIPLTKFSENVWKLGIQKGPIDNTQGIKEAYLCYFSEAGLYEVQKSQPETTWPDFVKMTRAQLAQAWIFQANPQIYDVRSAVRKLKEQTWSISRYRDQISPGDRVYLWESGTGGGIVAIAEVIDRPSQRTDLEQEIPFYRDPNEIGGEQIRVLLRIITIVDPIFTRTEIMNIPELANLSILRQPQGTNFRVTTEEAEVLEDLIAKPFDMKGIEELKTLFLNRYRDFKTFKNPGKDFIKQEDEWKRSLSKQMHELLDKWISSDPSTLKPEEVVTHVETILKSSRMIDWRHTDYIHDQLLDSDQKKEDFAGLLRALLRAASDKETVEGPLQKLLSWLKDQNCPANISNVLPSILLFYWNPNSFIFIKYTELTNFLKVIGEKPLGHGAPLTVSEYSRVLITMNSVRALLKDLAPRDMIDLQSFYFVAIREMQKRAQEKSKDKPQVKKGNGNGVITEPPISKYPELQSLNLILYGPPGTGKTYRIRNKYMPLFTSKDKTKRYEFVTFHQSYSYEDFVEGIKPCININKKGNEGSIAYEVKDGIFKQIVNRALQDPENHYAIFIDEINRANISRVLGELITLIEKDKRLTWDDSKGEWVGDMIVKLPYTHTQDEQAPLFGIPDNLHIIGTMNTADRSIALIDTALRRRFSFNEMVPDSSVISNSGKQSITKDEFEIDLVKLLDAMNERIELLYDRDHRIGHSYFLNIETYDQLERVFLETIIPLLQEYFYDDCEKIQSVFADIGDEYDSDSKPKAKGHAIITHSIADTHVIPGAANWELPQRRIYHIPKSISPDSIIKIYED